MLYVPHYQRPEANTDALPMCGGHSHLKMRAREYQSRWGLLNKMESHTCCTNWKSHEKCPEQEWEASHCKRYPVIRSGSGYPVNDCAVTLCATASAISPRDSEIPLLYGQLICPRNWDSHFILCISPVVVSAMCLVVGLGKSWPKVFMHQETSADAMWAIHEPSPVRIGVR